MNSKEVRIRQAIFPQDIGSIVVLNVAVITEWRHRGSNYEDLEPAEWEDLTRFERYAHGGPWLDPDLMKHNAHCMKEANGGILVAENKKNEIIGELDYVWGSDPPFGTRAQLIWIVVHPKWRREGVGSVLFNALEQLPFAKHCKCIRAWSEDEVSERFYSSVGFRSIGIMARFRLDNPKTLSLDSFSTVLRLEKCKEWQKKLPGTFQQVLGTNNHPLYDLIQSAEVEHRETLLGRPRNSPLPYWITCDGKRVGYVIVGHQLKLWLNHEMTEEENGIEETLRLVVKECVLMKFKLDTYVEVSSAAVLTEMGFQQVRHGTLLEKDWTL